MDLPEVAGLWFLPSAPDKKIAGRLRVSPSDIRLELTGSFSGSEGLDGSAVALIHGLVLGSRAGTHISLEQCWETKKNYGLPGFTTSELIVARGYIGHALVDPESARWKHCSFKLSPMSGWIARRGVRESWEPTLRVEYSHAPPLPFLDGTNLSLKLNPSILSVNSSRTRMVLEEDSAIEVQSEQGLGTVELLREVILPVRQFFSLAQDSDCSIREVQVAETAPTDLSATVRLFGEPIRVREPEEGKREPTPLFTLPEVQTELPQLVARWLGFVEQTGDLTSIYFSLRSDPPKFQDTRFLLLMQTLSLFPDEDVRAADALGAAHQGLLDRLREVLPAEGAAAHVLPSKNMLGLPGKIRALGTRYAAVVDPVVGSLNELVVETMTAWAFVVTRDSALRPGGNGGLFWLAERIDLLVRCALLGTLGFSPERVAAMMRRSPRYSMLLGQR